MRFFTLLMFIFLLGCASDDPAEPHADIFVIDRGAGEMITLQAPYSSIYYRVDVNADDSPDYHINVTEASGNCEFFIQITSSYSVLQEPNPFSPGIFYDSEASGNPSACLRSIVRIKYYKHNTLLEKIGTNYSSDALLVLDGTFQPSGTKYIPIALQQSGDTYYGWIEVKLNATSLVIKRSGLSNIPEQRIRAGQVD